MKVYITPYLREIKLNMESIMNNLSIENYSITKKMQVLTQEDFVNPIWGEDDSADDEYNSFDEFVGF